MVLRLDSIEGLPAPVSGVATPEEGAGSRHRLNNQEPGLASQNPEAFVISKRYQLHLKVINKSNGSNKTFRLFRDTRKVP